MWPSGAAVCLRRAEVYNLLPSALMPYADPANRELPFQSGSDTSHDAALRAQSFVGRQGVKVLLWFEGRGERGGTQKEAAEGLGIGRPSVCARVNALEQQGRLIKTSARRAGCSVYVARLT